MVGRDVLLKMGVSPQNMGTFKIIPFQTKVFFIMFTIHFGGLKPLCFGNAQMEVRGRAAWWTSVSFIQGLVDDGAGPPKPFVQRQAHGTSVAAMEARFDGTPA